MKILVGMSGGVDSAVAALLLKQEGHEIIAVTMSIWDTNNNKELKTKPNKNACYGPEESLDIEEARKISKNLDIPYHVIDCAKMYQKIVLDNFSFEYLSGRTPNPCIWCNSLVKFGILPSLAQKSGISFDKFATGHYAGVQYDETYKRYVLKKAKDLKKDQSYFLYRLKQQQLSKLIFPLENYLKDEVRNIAKNNNLAVYDKKESQDFYSGDFNDLIKSEKTEGNIVDTEGKILGKHNGLWNYTIGQRKGLNISTHQALYVTDIDSVRNIVVVGAEENVFSQKLTANELNWIAFQNLNDDLEVQAKIRSSAIPQDALIKKVNQSEVEVIFKEPVKAITPGQSIVFYKNDVVIGGGIISKQ